MGVFHFLDVGQGDCSIIQHPSGRTTVIDVCNARSPQRPVQGLGLLSLSEIFASEPEKAAAFGRGLLSEPTWPRSTEEAQGLLGLGEALGVQPPRPPDTPMTGALFGLGSALGPSRQSAIPIEDALPGLLAKKAEVSNEVNPIEYMRGLGIKKVFRFVLTHPEMDHMDGIADLFAEFNPINFWDTANSRNNSFPANCPYRPEDWRYYTQLRAKMDDNGVTRLTLYSGSRGPLYNAPGTNGEIQDGLHVLAPTRELVAEANRTGDYNDASYVILYRSNAGRILFCGDSHDNTWEHLLKNHLKDILDVDIMIAPHHGRASGRDRKFLSVVRPRLTLFGTAPSEYLDYNAWRSRDLEYITANQAGTVIVDTSGLFMQIYVTKEGFARKENSHTYYDPNFRAWYLKTLF